MLRTVTASPWTEEDRALMLGYRSYLATLCPGECGQPRELAHHWDNEGWYSVEDEDRTTCHACTALKQAGAKEPIEPVEFLTISHPRDYATKPLRPTPPKKPERRPRR